MTLYITSVVFVHDFNFEVLLDARFWNCFFCFLLGYFQNWLLVVCRLSEKISKEYTNHVRHVWMNSKTASFSTL